MTDFAGTFDDFVPSGRLRSSRKRSLQLGPAIVAMAGSALVAALILDVRPAFAPQAVENAAALTRSTPQPRAALLDPALALAFSSTSLGHGDPLAPNLIRAEAELPSPTLAVETTPSPVVEPEQPVAEAVVPPPAPAISPLIASVPTPVPRPSDLDTAREAPAPAPSHAPMRTAVAASRLAAPVAAPDARSTFEKLFGLSRPTPVPGQTLAYAAPEDGVMSRLFRSSVQATPDSRTAIYDIAAHTVFLPNGTQLEAHSGLGNRLDDPRFVHERNRGATPPHVYELTPRAQLFHGVQALRLTPVGEGGVFGRVGLLAHTFMLGPNGDSNGCVSFRNYNAFLQAYMNGDVKRLLVVTHRT